MMMDEVDVEDWLAYHLMIGFDHIFIYDNNSTLPVEERVREQPALAARVTVERFAFPEGVDYVNAQHYVFSRCMRERLHDSQWVAVLDADEYIGLFAATEEGGRSRLRSFLAPFARRPEVGAVGINWLSFGPSGRVRHPSGSERVIAAYQRRLPLLNLRAPAEFQTHLLVKSISRPCAVAHYNVHFPTLHADYVEVDALGRSSLFLSVNTLAFDRDSAQDVAAVFHYKTRSWLHVAARYSRRSLRLPKVQAAADSPARRCDADAAELYYTWAMLANETDSRLAALADEQSAYMREHRINTDTTERLIAAGMREQWFYGFPGWHSAKADKDIAERWLYNDARSDGCDHLQAVDARVRADLQKQFAGADTAA